MLLDCFDRAWIALAGIVICISTVASAVEMLPFRVMEIEREAQWAAAQISGKKGDSGVGGVVIIVYTSNEDLLNEVRKGGMQAEDTDGNPIEVRGVIVVPSDRDEFVVYGDGYPASQVLDGSDALRESKMAVEQIYEAIVAPGFFRISPDN